MNLLQMGEQAKQAARQLAASATATKNETLLAIAAELRAHTAEILAANRLDLEAGEKNGLTKALLDRLKLDEQRVEGIAAAVEEVVSLPDPVGEVVDGKRLANGLQLVQSRVPLGVVGIIFEARPNVTVDAAALCLKSGNAVILRGGKEAIHSNIALAGLMRRAIASVDLSENVVQLVEDTSRETATQMMKLNGYIDVLIPRGGAGLIQAVVQNATLPVIETGVGNCHVYVDRSADLSMAVSIVDNAKTSRPSVCNACEKVLVHRDIASQLLPALAKTLSAKQVELRGDEEAAKWIDGCIPATEEDWYREYLDYILAIRVVDDLDQAIVHIAQYSSGHSESIVTGDYASAQQFLREVDAAAVYVNASTRFTDGGEFGLGAEIGISTQKLHVRGPMGLKALTTTKYIVYGNGQIR